jgi:hypothetical protein
MMASATNSRFSKYITVLSLIIVLGVPVVHKLLAPIPPQWFISKYTGTAIDIVPFGIALSFGIIIILEVIGPLLFCIGLIKKEISTGQYKYITWGFKTTQILFLILTFGSFLVQDYDNGFKDFLYLFAVTVLELFFFERTEKRGS